MPIFAPPRQQVTGALIDTSGVNAAIRSLGQTFARQREQENLATIGKAAATGGPQAGRDTALKGGYLGQANQFSQQLAQQQARATAAAHRAQMMERQAQQDAESKRRFELQFGLQKQQADLRRQQLERGPAPTAMERHYMRAQSDPKFAKFLDKRRAQTNITVGSEKSYDKEIGKQLAKEFVTSQKESAGARTSLNNLNVIERALDDPNLYTGFGGQAVQNAKKMAQMFGVKVKGVGSGELVNTISREIALNNKDKLPGPMSNSDREFLVDMAPGLQNSRDGNRLVIQLGMLSKRYTIDKARIVQEYARANDGRLDTGVYAALGQLDDQYASQFGGLMQQLRSVGETAPASPLAGFPRVQSLEQWRNVPSGQQYIDPQGNVRTKQ